MKLNDDQRIVMQALLDGKNVVVLNYKIGGFYNVTWDTISKIPALKYRIEESPIKVALFKRHDRIIAATEDEYNEMVVDEWVRTSDWVEIVPITSSKY